jgi:hypothetical protein
MFYANLLGPRKTGRKLFGLSTKRRESLELGLKLRRFSPKNESVDLREKENSKTHHNEETETNFVSLKLAASWILELRCRATPD